MLPLCDSTLAVKGGADVKHSSTSDPSSSTNKADAFYRELALVAKLEVSSQGSPTIWDLHLHMFDFLEAIFEFSRTLPLITYPDFSLIIGLSNAHRGEDSDRGDKDGELGKHYTGQPNLHIRAVIVGWHFRGVARNRQMSCSTAIFKSN